MDEGIKTLTVGEAAARLTVSLAAQAMHGGYVVHHPDVIDLELRITSVLREWLVEQGRKTETVTGTVPLPLA